MSTVTTLKGNKRGLEVPSGLRKGCYSFGQSKQRDQHDAGTLPLSVSDRATNGMYREEFNSSTGSALKSTVLWVAVKIQLEYIIQKTEPVERL